jgi:hypothetical protein
LDSRGDAESAEEEKGMRELDDITGGVVDAAMKIHIREGLRRIVNDLPSSASPRLRVNQ